MQTHGKNHHGRSTCIQRDLGERLWLAMANHELATAPRPAHSASRSPLRDGQRVCDSQPVAVHLEIGGAVGGDQQHLQAAQARGWMQPRAAATAAAATAAAAPAAAQATYLEGGACQDDCDRRIHCGLGRRGARRGSSKPPASSTQLPPRAPSLRWTGQIEMVTHRRFPEGATHVLAAPAAARPGAPLHGKSHVAPAHTFHMYTQLSCHHPSQHPLNMHHGLAGADARGGVGMVLMSRWWC